MSANQRFLLFLGVILLIGVFVTWWSVERRDESEPELPPAAASLADDPVAMYTDLKGNRFSLETYLGNVLVVTSWASWCPFCGEDLAKFADIATEYSEAGVVIIAINRAERKAIIDSYLTTIPNTAGIVFALDPNDRFYTSIQGYTTPETVFYDAAGNIVFHKRGTISREEIRRQLNAILSNTP